MVSNDPAVPSGASTTVMKTDLEADAIGLLGATMQAITHIAPAIAGFFFTAFIVSLAGITVAARVLHRVPDRADARQHAGPARDGTCRRRAATTPMSAAACIRGRAS